VGADLAMLAGAMAGSAADAGVVLPVLARRAAEVMERAARFAAGYRTIGDLPEAGDSGQIQPVIARFTSAAATPGMSEGEARELAEAWFTADEWVQPMLYLGQRKEVRAALPERQRLMAAAEPVRQQISAAHWLYGLLLVLDDEPLTVLHRPTGRGYHVAISGIGDNFQLHTLLAARLIGDEAEGMLPGQPPTAAMIAAATDGSDLTPAGGLTGQFNLVDGYGQWIWNEGRPADIPRLEGERVVVLDPPPYPRTWNAGRAYPLMHPALTVHRTLTADEVARWFSIVKPPQLTPTVNRTLLLTELLPPS
jgi:hypothetical protein